MNLGQLEIVDFYKEFETPELAEWKNKKLGSRVICAENCARYIFMGSQEEMSDFPDPIAHDEYKRITGKEAYAHILKFMLGFLNPNGYDPASSDRFYIGWQKINNRNPRISSVYGEVVQNLSADLMLLRRNFCDAIKPNRLWLVARDLVGQQTGDNVLLIGDVKDRNDQITMFTEKMAVTVNGSGVCPASDLSISHPDPEKAQIILEHMRRLQEIEKLRVPVYKIDFEADLAFAFECSDRVYITADMERYPDADEMIISAWRNRNRNDNFMVHLKASAGEQGIESERWKNAGLDNFILPSEIRAASEDRRYQYKKISEAVKLAANACAEIRASARQPVRESICKQVPALKAA